MLLERSSHRNPFFQSHKKLVGANFSAERQNFKDAQLQLFFGFTLPLCIEHATDASIQLIAVDP